MNTVKALTCPACCEVKCSLRRWHIRGPYNSWIYKSWILSLTVVNLISVIIITVSIYFMDIVTVVVIDSLSTVSASSN